MPQENGKAKSFDVGRQQVGHVYAQALLGAAVKAGNAEAVANELHSLVVDVLEKAPDFDSLLASPRVEHVDKLKVLDKAFSGKMSPTLLNFLKVVSRQGRLDSLREISQQTRQLLNQSLGRVEVSVTTAEPISSQLLESVSLQLKGALKRDIDLQTRIDDEILGGMVVRVGDTVYDASVAGQFARLREKTLEKAAAEIRQAGERFTAQ